MASSFTLAILSDIHYACAAEQARGSDYEFEIITNPLLRLVFRTYRHFLWMRHPLQQNPQLDRFLAQVGPVDCVVANGDYCCNTAFVGLSDDATFQSAAECLAKLRGKFGDRLRLNFGDHELGKFSVFGTRGGMLLASWRRATEELGLQPFWRAEFGRYVLIGVTSSLIALPVFAAYTSPVERPEWERLRERHLAEIRAAFGALDPGQRVLLFCHDPTALPFLWREEAVRNKLPQVEQTIIGHLHSKLFFGASNVLSGLPVIRFLGHSAQRMSTALNEARHWKLFRVRLCPALAGIELLNDGGYLTAELDSDTRQPARFQFHPLPR